MTRIERLTIFAELELLSCIAAELKARHRQITRSGSVPECIAAWRRYQAAQATLLDRMHEVQAQGVR